MEHIDLRLITEHQSAKFSCPLPDAKYDHVNFAPISCDLNVTKPKQIIHPATRKWEFAICTKVWCIIITGLVFKYWKKYTCHVANIFSFSLLCSVQCLSIISPSILSFLSEYWMLQEGYYQLIVHCLSLWNATYKPIIIIHVHDTKIDIFFFNKIEK